MPLRYVQPRGWRFFIERRYILTLSHGAGLSLAIYMWSHV